MDAVRNWSWKDIGELAGAERWRGVGARFELEFLESAVRAEPENIDLLLELGCLYIRAGRIADSLAVDLHLVRTHPEEPVFHYNLACSYSLAGKVERALRALAEAIARGYRDVDHIRTDRDLDNLKGDRRFEQLLSRLRDKQHEV